MALPQFIFGGDTGLTPEAIKRNRAVAEALMGNMSSAPRNVGEGLSAIGQALLYRSVKSKADKGEAYAKDQQKGIWGALTGGMPSMGGAGASAAPGPAASDGRYTAADVGATAAPVSTAPGDGDIYGSFINTVKGGITNPFGLAAVAATGKRESGYSAGNAYRQWSDPSESGQPGQAGGIMSWRAERLTAMRDFAAKNGGDPNRPSPELQARFFLNEDPRLIERLNNAKSVEEAQQAMNQAWAFAGWDRPGGEAGARFAAARAYLPEFQGGQSQAPTQVASLDPSAGMGSVPAPTAPSAMPDASTTAAGRAMAGQGPQGGMTPVAAALAGQPPAPTPAPRQVADAGGMPPPMPQQAPPQMPSPQPMAMPTWNGPDPRAMMQVLQNPYASDDQRQIAQYHLQQYGDFQQQAQKMVYDERVRQQGFQREDARFAVEDRREDARLGLDQAKFAREAMAPIEVGGALIDPQTMRPLYEAPDKPTGNMQEYDAYAADERAAGRQPIGRLEYETALRKSGAATSNINTGTNSSKFSEESDKAAAGRLNDIVTAGNAAPTFLADVQQLADLGRQIGTGRAAQVVTALGPYAEAFGIDMETLGPAEAYKSIIARMAPNMRPAGSGSSSDFDARQFLQSLPSLGNSPEGNQIITDTFQAVQENKIQAAEIASQAYLPLDQGGITWQEAERQIRTLPNPYTRFKEMQRAAGRTSPDTTRRDGGVPVGGQGASEPSADGWQTLPNGVRIRVKQ